MELIMPYYSDEVLGEVFAASDIVEYVSQYVQLKKNGRDYSGLCPFHREKSPSFHVSADKQLFHCFGCGASGNLIQFVMRMENLDFVEALKLMAERAGIELPEENYGNDELFAKKQRFWDMNKTAARFFYNCLTKTGEGAEARDYLAKRQITKKTVVSYGLGYSPSAWDSLLNHLKTSGYTEEEICENSLAVSRDGRIYDKFRSRVMFPIIDLRGHIIGFGGRIIKEPSGDFKPPKYLNSSETVCFSKGNNLFSLNVAKNAEQSSIILSEGYMDVISVYQAGIRNTVATLGTALTENQAKLLSRYCREILICYDSDEAGVKATNRAIDIINSVGGKSRVMKLGDVKDPDEFIKKYGADAFKKAMKEAVASTQYKINSISVKYDINSTEDKIKFVNETAQSLSSVKDNIEVDAYVNKISGSTGISREAIYSAIKKQNRPMPELREKTPDIPRKNPSSDNNNSNAVNNKIIRTEKQLLSVIYKNKRLCAMCGKEIPAEEFCLDLHKKLADLIYKSWENKIKPEPDVILTHLDPSEQSEAGAVFYGAPVFDNEETAVKDLIYTIKLEKLQIEINKEADFIKKQRLINEKQKLIQAKLNLEGASI